MVSIIVINEEFLIVIRVLLEDVIMVLFVILKVYICIFEESEIYRNWFLFFVMNLKKLYV